MRDVLKHPWFLAVVGAVLFAGTLALIRTGGGWPPWPTFRTQFLTVARHTPVDVSGTFQGSSVNTDCPVIVVGKGQPVAEGTYVAYFPQGTSRNGDTFTVRDTGPSWQVSYGSPATFSGFTVTDEQVGRQRDTIRAGRHCEGVAAAGFVVQGT